MKYILENKDNTYMLINLIGKGATSFCFKGYKNGSNIPLAIKIYKKCNISSFYTETYLLKILNSDVFLSLYNKGEGYLYKEEDKSNSSNHKKKLVFFTVIELAENKELFDYININKKGFGERISAQIFLKVLKGIQIMHARSIAHCDIKPENILLDKDFNIKIIDFGYSRIMNFSENKIKEFQGTDMYSSPETKILDFNGNLKEFDPIKNDIFSLGVFLFVINFGLFPFAICNSYDKLYSHIVHNDYDGYWKFFEKYNISEELKDLINHLICFNPNDRYSIEQILGHSWIKQNIGENGQPNEELFKNELKKRKNNIEISKNEVNDKQ